MRKLPTLACSIALMLAVGAPTASAKCMSWSMSPSPDTGATDVPTNVELLFGFYGHGRNAAVLALDKVRSSARGDEKIGVDIVRRALEAPMRMIAANAGTEGAIVVQKVLEGKDAFGYNADTDKYEDMIKAGVPDPTMVTRSALENAASIASLMLTTEAVISEIPEENKAAAGAPDMGAMGGMGGMGGM